MSVARCLLVLALSLADVSVRADGPSGWIRPSSTNEVFSVLFVDLDGDGTREVIARTVGFASFEGAMSEAIAYSASGRRLWSFEAPELTVQDHAAGDVDGDGRPEIVISTDRFNGELYVLEHDGTVKPGWPQQGGNEDYRAPTLVDLDGDGVDEIVVGWVQDFPATRDPELRAYRGDGTLLWAREGPHENLTHTAVGDLDHDGTPELVTTFFSFDIPWASTLRVSRADGVPTGRAIGFSDQQAGAPALADVDRDGTLEIAVISSIRQPDGAELHLYDATGELRPGWPVELDDERLGSTSPTIADLDGDGDLELVVHGKRESVHAFHHDGTVVEGWPVADPDPGSVAGAATVVADVDGDGQVEVMWESIGSGDACQLVVHRADGQPLPGSPIALPANGIECRIRAITVGSVDGLTSDVAFGVAEPDDTRLLSLPFPLDASRLEWPTKWHDVRRSSNYHTPIFLDDPTPR